MRRLLLPRLAVILLPLALAGCWLNEAEAPTGRNYLVFFSEWSAQLDQPALGVIAAAAVQANMTPTLPVTVAGYADPTGSPQANVDMPRLRAQVVEDQLVADGVARSRIHRSAHGATNFTGSSQESRRVDINIGAS